MFVGYVGDGVDLFTINADGSDLRNLINIAGHVTQPRWSPDGNQIVYVDSDSDNTDIYVMDADGSDNRQLTSGMDHKGNPVWSPDGTQIIVSQSRLAISGDLTGRSNLYLISADGSNQRLLLEDAAIGGDPAWRPISRT